MAKFGNFLQEFLGFFPAFFFAKQENPIIKDILIMTLKEWQGIFFF